MVLFVFSNEDKTEFEEVKVIAFSEIDGTLVPLDSVNHYPLKSHQFRITVVLGLVSLQRILNPIRTEFLKLWQSKKIAPYSELKSG